MNPYQYTVVCDVCGEPGVAHVKHAGAEYTGGFFSHTDPRVCADNLKRKARNEDQGNIPKHEGVRSSEVL